LSRQLDAGAEAEPLLLASSRWLELEVLWLFDFPEFNADHDAL